MISKQKFSAAEALQKLKHFCAYQERSHQEVKEKLYGYGLFKNEVEQTITQLIEENYLNEERYAIAFAGGRFRIKQWGKIKIAYELKQQHVSAYIITKALKAIDGTDYENTLQKLAAKKWASLKGEHYLQKPLKTTRYLMQKGFEPALVAKVVKNLK